MVVVPCRAYVRSGEALAHFPCLPSRKFSSWGLGQAPLCRGRRVGSQYLATRICNTRTGVSASQLHQYLAEDNHHCPSSGLVERLQLLSNEMIDSSSRCTREHKWQCNRSLRMTHDELSSADVKQRCKAYSHRGDLCVLDY